MLPVKPILTKIVLASSIALMITTAVLIAAVSESDSDTEGVLLSPMHGGVKKLGADPDRYLTEFNYGRASALPDGTTLREFTIVAQDTKIEVAPGVYFDAWTYNGTVPGPTIRVTEGDRVKVTFINQGSHPHTMHFHGKHSGDMDGAFEWVAPGGRFVYEFIAAPFGLHLYHCHVSPVEEHMNRGLYGVFIIDPKTPRPPATEMVMLMNGYDTDFDTENNFYTVNGIAFHYMRNPIQLKVGETVRLYLVNLLEFDQINNFHLHGDLFKLYRTGTSLENYELTDMVTMSQGERAILEFRYDYPGSYMFHAHKIEFADKGWMGLFQVVDESVTNGAPGLYTEDNEPRMVMP